MKRSTVLPFLKGVAFALSVVLALSAAAPAAAQRGRKAPDFHVLDIDGREIWLSRQLKGCGVVLFFFEANPESCPECAELARALVQAHQQLRDQGVVFIGFNTDFEDPEERAREFAVQNEVPFSIVTQDVDAIVEAYGIQVEVPKTHPVYKREAERAAAAGESLGSLYYVLMPGIVLVSPRGTIQLGPEQWYFIGDFLLRQAINRRTFDYVPVSAPPYDVISAIKTIAGSKTCKVGRDVLP